MTSRRIWTGIWVTVFALSLTAFAATADFVPQPEGWASALTSVAGPAVEDWQLANAVSMWIVPRGFSHLLFVFGASFGGGMIDDLQEVLDGRGDAALISASRHDEWAWIVDEATLDESRAAWRRLGIDRTVPLFVACLLDQLRRPAESPRTLEEAFRLAAQADPARQGGSLPNGDPWEEHSSGRSIVEHAQWLALGNGGTLALATHESIQSSSERYAILFGGDGESLAAWNQAEYIRDFLTDEAGVTPENIYILIGQGPGTTRPDGKTASQDVSGPGTRQALWDVLRSVGAQMDDRSDFLFWALGNGERARNLGALNQVVREPGRTVLRIPLPSLPADPSPGSSPVFDLDPSFLGDVLSSPDNPPAISLYAVGLDASLCGGNLIVRVNGAPAACGHASEVVTWDRDLEADCTEFVFSMPDESALRLENTIDVTWAGPAGLFSEYTLLGLSISSGPISASLDSIESAVREPWALPPGNVAWTIGTSATGPTLDAASWCNAKLATGPFFITSATEATWLPTLSVGESLAAGIQHLWWALSAEADATLYPWAFERVGAWIAFEPPTWEFGDMPTFSLDADCGWGPQWLQTSGFTQGIAAFAGLAVEWAFDLWNGAVNLSTNTEVEGTLDWPGWALAADWQVSGVAAGEWAIFPQGGPRLQVESCATATLMPSLGVGIEICVALASETYIVYLETGIGTGNGFWVKLGAEYGSSFAWP